MTNDLTIADIGEQAALARILPRLQPAANAIVGPGDDCAVLRAGGDTVITTDTMFEGTDFRLDWSTFTDLGTKAVTTNLTDVAAMGAKPTALVIALGVRADTLVAQLEQFADAVSAAITEQAPDAGVVGGDLSVTNTTTIAVTALGDMEGRTPVLRSGARPGDAIVAVGSLGLSGEGLGLLMSGTPATQLWEQQPHLARAHLAPLAPVTAGVVLADLGATSMLDVSDGLVLDAYRIARASGVRLRFDRDALESFGVSLESVLYGGEDHALLASVPPDAVDGVLEAVGSEARVIGDVDAGEPAVTLGAEVLEERGWDPFTRP